MKKKILAIALVVAMLAVAVVSASLAYFTDEEYATNTFTVGEVDITLKEEFDQNSEIFPGVDETKKVWVENTSTTGNDAYIRVHVAFPVELAPRSATTDTDGNITGYTYDINGEDGLAIVTANTSEWTWTDIYSADIGEEDTVDGDGNIVKKGTIVPCVVYVATYKTSVAAGGKTSNAITAVRLNEKADTDIIKTGDPAVEHLHLFMDLNNDGEWDAGELRVDTQGTNPFKIEVEVAAEAVQVEGFEGAEEALDKAFGNPGEYNLTGTDESENKVVWTDCETKTIVNNNNETVDNPDFPSANP